MVLRCWISTSERRMNIRVPRVVSTVLVDPSNLLQPRKQEEVNVKLEVDVSVDVFESMIEGETKRVWFRCKCSPNLGLFARYAFTSCLFF